MRFVPILLLSSALASASAFAQAPASPVLEQFQHLDDDWSVALVNKDQYALANLLAANYIDIGADGSIRTRNQTITDALGSVPQPLLSIQQRVIDVRVVGDMAVVDGTYKLTWKVSSATTRDERGVYTHVYQREHNAWACINAQRTATVDEDSGDGRKHQSTVHKPSNAALPFHIPLITHDSSTAPTPPTTSNPQ